jgi:hypothetical protein
VEWRKHGAGHPDTVVASEQPKIYLIFEALMPHGGDSRAAVAGCAEGCRADHAGRVAVGVDRSDCRLVGRTATNAGKVQWGLRDSSL